MGGRVSTGRENARTQLLRDSTHSGGRRRIFCSACKSGCWTGPGDAQFGPCFCWEGRDASLRSSGSTPHAARITLVAGAGRSRICFTGTASMEAQCIEVPVGNGSGEEGLHRLGGLAQVQRILSTRHECLGSVPATQEERVRKDLMTRLRECWIRQQHLLRHCGHHFAKGCRDGRKTLRRGQERELFQRRPRRQLAEADSCHSETCRNSREG